MDKIHFLITAVKSCSQQKNELNIFLECLMATNNKFIEQEDKLGSQILLEMWTVNLWNDEGDSQQQFQMKKKNK